MKVYGLVGPSGTGKSYRASEVAQQVGAEAIIDDGLLISNGRILAGFSAKFETNAISAVKRAIFSDETHREQVDFAIRARSLHSVLILGTSQRMILSICDRLHLPDDVQWVPIETVSSSRNVGLAGQLRRQGMHAIPVLQAQLEEPRFHAFMRRLRVALSPTKSSRPRPLHLTVVTPAFSGGVMVIHPRVIRDVMEAIVSTGDYPFELRRVDSAMETYATITVTVDTQWLPGFTEAAERLLNDIHQYLENNLGFVDPEVIVRIASIHPPA